MNASAPFPKKPAYPLRFSPVYKDYLWGGDRILRHFRRAEPPGIYAESWEVSTRPEGPSIVANGPLAGTPLAQLIPDFPLLLKLIDARQTLSVQVHPNNKTAAWFGGEAKTEMWYVLAADPGACVYCGLKPDTDEARLRAALASKTVADLLVEIPVVPGDAIFVPGGRVHAIGAGCLLFECQQNSNTTYRLYDWDRTGPDGKPRELHIEQSIRVINWADTTAAKVLPRLISDDCGNRRWLIQETPYFRMERLELTTPFEIPSPPKPEIHFVISGSLQIAGETVPAGTSILLPPGLPATELIPSGPTELLRITA